MRNYILNFMKKFDYPTEAVESLISDYDKIVSDENAKKELCECIEIYKNNINCNYYDELIVKIDKAVENIGIHKYSAELIMFMCMSEHLKKLYKERNISDEIWHNSMLDLKWKLFECKAVKNMWGSFVAWWFPGFFNLTRFALGRLQFEIVKFEADDYTKDGKTVKTGDKVINVHIPRTLTPLDKASCDDAYAQAKEFFKNEFENQPIAFVCYSWLLYSKNKEILPEKSNVRRFMSEYEIIKDNHDKDGEHPDMWRLFDMDYTGNIDDYPENTSLRRVFKQYLKNGGTTGEGYGIFFA